MITDDRPDTSHRWAWLPRPVLLLVIARAVNQLGAFSLPFLAVLMVVHRGASLSEAGLVVALFGLATIPSRLAGARLSQLLGARSTMVLGLSACAGAQLGIAAARGLVTTTVAVVVLGLAFEIYEPASQSLIADLTEARHRPRAFGLLGAALALGGLGGGLLGVGLGGLDLRLLFVVDAVSCLACALLVWLGLPGDRPAPASGGARGADGCRPWRDRRLLAMLATSTGFATLYLQLRIALPLTFVARHLPVEAYGVVIAVSSLTVVLAQPLLAWSRLPADPFTVMSIGYSVLAAGLVSTALVSSLPGFVLATVVWAIGDVLLLGHPFAVVVDLAPPGGSARYLAVFGLCWGIGGVLAPIVGTAMLTALGPTGLWLACGAGAAALAAAQPWVRRLVAAPGPSSTRSDQFFAYPRRRGAR